MKAIPQPDESSIEAALLRAEQEVRRLEEELRRRVAERADEMTVVGARLSAADSRHQRAEDALRDSQDRFSGLIERAYDAVVMMNSLGLVEEWNPRAEQIFGWTREEAMGRKIAELIVPERHRQAHLQGIDNYLRTGHGRVFNRQMELPALHRAGHEILIELSIWPVRSQGATVFGAFIRDISAKKHEQAAQQARQARSLRFNDALFDLSRLNKTDFDAALATILEASATTLGVERVSYWRIAEDSLRTERVMLYSLAEAAIDRDAGELAFDAAGYPDYFAALQTHAPIVASRALEHPATREFAAAFLRPAGITSILDVGVWFQGRMAGLIRHAHVGEPRDWESAEVEFAAAIAGMVSLALEASHRNALSVALRESEEKYRLVVEHANEAIIVAQDGFVRFCNPLAIALSGYSAEEYYRTPFIEMIHPEDRALVIDNYRRRLAGADVEDAYEFRILSRQGETRWLTISAVVIEWEGRPATLNFLSDITERHDLQEQLRQTLYEREAILQTSVVGIVFTRDRQIRWSNRTFEQQMLGYAEGELVGQSTEICYTSRQDYEREGESAYEVIAQDGTWESEIQMRRKDGSLFWCHETGRARNPNDLAQGAIWIMSDVTRRHMAEEDLRRALEQERELSELKSRFVAMTSHEFRTPLATILSATELLEMYGERLPAQEKTGLIALTKSAVERMTKMLEDVLLIGKADASRVEFQPRPLRVRELVDDVLREVGQQAGAAGSVVVECHGEAGTAALDEKLLRHILGNLLSNAIKYSPAGAPVRLTLHSDPLETVFEVGDRGIGIPQEDQPRLFTTFHRGHNVSNISGTGLGLAIVKKCVDLHGGSISFVSEVGKGTTFVVRIPRSNEASHAQDTAH